jgi:putative radical SAM enzyme (TIGR03279 family)
MSSPTIVAVATGSPAELAGLQPGDEITRVDGLAPRDVIEWQYATDEADIEIDLIRGGLERSISIPKRAGEPLGVEVQSAVFDRVRTCDNHCEFCFIYQLPKGMRRSLYLKDDDYRLSFLYGNFTTLTRFTESDFERVVTERLSPLHVSIHAVDHDLRNRMLKNQRGGMSLRWIRALLDHAIEIKGQIVVCPGINDGDALDGTLAGVLDRFPELTSVAVVPLGLSKYNTEPAMRPHTHHEAARVVDIVDAWQQTFLEVLGRRMVFAADEYYLMAGVDFPAAETYDGFAMHEDGIGMARTFELEFEGMAPQATGVRSGFFAAVDLPSNPAAYTGLRSGGGSAAAIDPQPVTLGARRQAPDRARPTGVLTGPLGAKVIAPLIDRLDRRDVTVLTVPNDFFGGNTGVTGLMTGEDVSRVLSEHPDDWRYLLPDVCLSDDGRFLDGVTVDQLPRRVEVLPTDGIALRRALEQAA